VLRTFSRNFLSCQVEPISHVSHDPIISMLLIGQNHGDDWYSSAPSCAGRAQRSAPAIDAIDSRVDRTFLFQVFLISAAQKFLRAA